MYTKENMLRDQARTVRPEFRKGTVTPTPITPAPVTVPRAPALVTDLAASAPYSFAQFLRDVRSVAVYDGNVAQARQRLQFRGVPAGGSEQDPSGGGLLVGSEFLPDLVNRIFLSGIVAGMCFEVPLRAKNSVSFPRVDESSRADGSRWGGVRAYWMNEADALQATKPKFGLSTLTAKKLTCLSYATDELDSDADAFAVLTSSIVSGEFAFKLDDALINGDGAGKPQGILNSPALITVAAENAQTTGTILAANVTKMVSRLAAASWPGACWFVCADAIPQLAQLTITVGTGGGSAIPLLHYPEAQGESFMLCGFPLYVLEQAQALGTLGDVILADMSRMALALRTAMDAAASIHVNFLSDQSVYRWIMRVDSQGLESSPLTPFKGTNTVSPFITLAAR